MPYFSHECLDEPTDPNTRLCRYMDFPKLASILLGKSLFFPSGKTLSAQDKFEGQPTYTEVNSLNILATPPLDEEITTVRQQLVANFRSVAPSDQSRQIAIIETIAFFNCWHMNDFESDAMWKVYGAGNQGLTIQSTVGRLRKSFGATEAHIFMGKVRYYAEPDNVSPNTAIYIWRFMRKKRAFEHEKELRAVVIDGRERGNAGVNIPIYIDDLIERIVISPYAEPWFMPLVKKFVCRLGHNFEVVASEAAGPPPSTMLLVEPVE